MTWKISLTGGDCVFTDDNIDLDSLRFSKWLRVNALARAVGGNLLHDRPERITYVNTRRIITVKEVDL